MSESNVAQEQIKAYVDRILRMKDEADAVASDIKEIYTEAKANGFDKTQLGNLVSYLRKKDKDGEKLAEGEAIFDLYLTAYYSAKGQVGTPRATHTHASEASKVAALRADPAMAIVEAADITPKSNLQNVQSAQTEPRPTKAASGDLTALAPNDGQVAPTQPETATEKPKPSEARTTDPQRSVEATRKDAFSEGSGPHVYADPGVITWESTPPEGVERHPYSSAFGTLGQDAVVIADDIAMAKAAPIVKMGNIILDGWARYMTARGSVGLTGQSTEYPVVQYGGTDPLLDCIRWNIAGRILSDKDKQTVVARLSAIEPKRKADILKAVAELAI